MPSPIRSSVIHLSSLFSLKPVKRGSILNKTSFSLSDIVLNDINLPNYIHSNKSLDNTDISEFEHTFNKISYEQGVRHIHSLEHIETIHKFGCPFFKILSTTKPQQKANFTFILATYTFLNFGTNSLLMFTDKRDESNIICLDPSKPFLSIHTKVSRTKHNTQGHNIKIRVHHSRQYNWLRKVFYSFLKEIFILEDTLCWSYDFRGKVNIRDYENLAKYRRMVLF